MVLRVDADLSEVHFLDQFLSLRLKNLASLLRLIRWAFNFDDVTTFREFNVNLKAKITTVITPQLHELLLSNIQISMYFHSSKLSQMTRKFSHPKELNNTLILTTKKIVKTYLWKVTRELLDGGSLLADDVLVQPGRADDTATHNGVCFLVDFGQRCLIINKMTIS